jgi:hypothetical protein
VANYLVFTDGVSTASLGSQELQYKVGPYDPADPHTYTVAAVDEADHTGPSTPALEALPQLAGLQLDAARAALSAKGFAAGDVTVVDSQQPQGTVVGPQFPVAAEPGTAEPLEVSAGPGGAGTKFVFNVVGTKQLVLAQRNFIGVHIATTRVTVVTATLVSPARKALYTWHAKAHAGVSILKLKLPKRKWTKGVYSLRWTAVAGTDVVHHVTPVQILRTKKDLATRIPSSVDVVVAGSVTVPMQATKTLQADSEETTFELSGDPKRNVTAIVIDADTYTLGMIHDLHTVFPTVKLIALSSDPAKRLAAVKAGATLALPKTTPPPKLAKAVAALAGPISRR